jgi:hypothetical protein
MLEEFTGNFTQGMANASGNYDPTGFKIGDLNKTRSEKFLGMYVERLIGQMHGANNLWVGDNTLEFTGSYNGFPTLEQSWNDFRSEAQRNGVRADYNAFKSLYDSVNQQYQNYMTTQVSGLLSSGTDKKVIQEYAKKNTAFKDYMMRIGMTNPELAAMIQDVMPERSLAREYANNPGKYKFLAAAGGIGALSGAAFLNTTPQSIIDEAKAKYKTKKGSIIQNVKDLRKTRLETENKLRKLAKEKQKLRNASAETKKTKAWQNKLKKVNADLDKAWADHRRQKPAHQAAHGDIRSKVREARGARDVASKQTRWGKFTGPEGKWGKMGKFTKSGIGMGAYTMGPLAADALVEGLTGSDVLGEGAGLGTGALVSGVATTGFGKGVKKKGIQKALKTTPKGALKTYIQKKGAPSLIKLIMKKGGPRFALKVLGKGALSGSGVGALFSGAMLASDLKQIYNWIQEDLGDTTWNAPENRPKEMGNPYTW